MQQFVKFVRHFLAPHFYENHAALLWFVREAQGYGIAALFAKRATIRQTRRVFMAKGAAILGLRCSTRRCSHQSAALLPSKCGAFGGRKRHECRHVFRCRCGTFVAFFLTLTVRGDIPFNDRCSHTVPSRFQVMTGEELSPRGPPPCTSFGQQTCSCTSSRALSREMPTCRGQRQSAFLSRSAAVHSVAVELDVFSVTVENFRGCVVTVICVSPGYVCPRTYP